MATGYSTTCPSNLSSDILYDCSSLNIKGFGVEGVIVNRNDIDFKSFTSLAEGSIDVSNFPMKTGTKGYRIQQPANNPFTGTQIELNVGNYFSTFNKTVSFLIFVNENSRIPDNLANGEFVVILRKKVIPNSSQSSTINGYNYLIFGLDGGLKATEITRDFYDEDNNGAWLVNLVEEGAPTAMRRLISSTPGGEEAILASLLETAE